MPDCPAGYTVSGKKKPDYTEYLVRRADNPAGYPASGKKYQIRLNPEFEYFTYSQAIDAEVAKILKDVSG